jgi:hypothetical protein
VSNSGSPPVVRALGDHLPELERPLAAREEAPFQSRARRVQLRAGGGEQPFALPAGPAVQDHVTHERSFGGFELGITAEQPLETLGVHLLEERVAAYPGRDFPRQQCLAQRGNRDVGRRAIRHQPGRGRLQRGGHLREGEPETEHRLERFELFAQRGQHRHGPRVRAPGRGLRPQPVPGEKTGLLQRGLELGEFPGASGRSVDLLRRLSQ